MCTNNNGFNVHGLTSVVWTLEFPGGTQDKISHSGALCLKRSIKKPISPLCPHIIK